MRPPSLRRRRPAAAIIVDVIVLAAAFLAVDPVIGALTGGLVPGGFEPTGIRGLKVTAARDGPPPFRSRSFSTAPVVSPPLPSRTASRHAGARP